MALVALIHRKRPSLMQRLWEAPAQTLAKTLLLHRHHRDPSFVVSERPITVVCVSDTHTTQPDLPKGDLLVHAGDLTQNGSLEELQIQLDWLNKQPHLHKIAIAGNHDYILDSTKCLELGKPLNRDQLQWGSVKYLEESSTVLQFSGGRSLTVFGHPWTSKHGNWAFQYQKGTDVFTNKIPEDVDILVTHSPPKTHLDLADWGDNNLLRELWRTRPKLHVFGHIHGGYGRETLVYDRFEELYEQVCISRAGFLAILEMIYLLFLGWAWPSSIDTQRTVLINASAVGGLTDQEIRKAEVVVL